MGDVAKETQFQIRATEEEKAEWAAAAKVDDCENVSQWFRKIARARIRAQKTKIVRAGAEVSDTDGNGSEL